MRCYPTHHQFDGGLDLHARTMSLCVLNQAGESLRHRHRQAGPEPFLQALAPYREDLVVCVEGLCTWSWLADLCPAEGLPLVLGQALSMKASDGGKANNDTIDAQKLAVWRRAGMRPQAYVQPAAMRATRALLRRRLPLPRKRAERLPHVQQTNWPYNLPELGQTIADKAHRHGGAARFPDPAVHKSGEVDRALIDFSDQ